MTARPSYTLTCIAMLAMALSAASAHAAEPAAPVLSFSGFGTVGLVHSSEQQADFTSSILKPNGAGYTHTWSADVDSLIGGQVTADFSSQLSAVLQVISEQNYDDTYRPHVEWANVKYQVTPGFSVRAGRTLLPTFLRSDTRKVAYTYPWVRPPLEVYHLVPASNINGVDARYRLRSGDITNSFAGQLRQCRDHATGRRHNQREAGVEPVLYGRISRRNRTRCVSIGPRDPGLR